MRPIPLTASFLGGLAILALAGCTPQQTGGDGSPTTANSNSTTTGAPAVANPLDTTKLQQNLCNGLTPAQLAPYVGEVRKTQMGNAAAPSCILFPTDNAQSTVTIAVFPNQTTSDMLAAGGNFPYSKQASPIQGYTALDASQNNPPNGTCGTSVAVANHVAVQVLVQNATETNPHYNNTCTASEALAEQLVNNLKASG